MQQCYICIALIFPLTIKVLKGQSAKIQQYTKMEIKIHKKRKRKREAEKARKREKSNSDKREEFIFLLDKASKPCAIFIVASSF